MASCTTRKGYQQQAAPLREGKSGASFILARQPWVSSCQFCHSYCLLAYAVGLTPSVCQNCQHCRQLTVSHSHSSKSFYFIWLRQRQSHPGFYFDVLLIFSPRKPNEERDDVYDDVGTPYRYRETHINTAYDPQTVVRSGEGRRRALPTPGELSDTGGDDYLQPGSTTSSGENSGYDHLDTQRNDQRSYTAISN